MSFWEDASPVVKGAIVVGALGLIYFAIAAAAGMPPFGGGAEGDMQENRGLVSPEEAAAAAQGAEAE